MGAIVGKNGMDAIGNGCGQRPEENARAPAGITPNMDRRWKSHLLKESTWSHSYNNHYHRRSDATTVG